MPICFLVLFKYRNATFGDVTDQYLMERYTLNLTGVIHEWGRLLDRSDPTG